MTVATILLIGLPVAYAYVVTRLLTRFLLRERVRPGPVVTGALAYFAVRLATDAINRTDTFKSLEADLSFLVMVAVIAWRLRRTAPRPTELGEVFD